MPSLRPRLALLSFSLLALTGGPLCAQLPAIAEKTRGLARHEGFIPFYWDSATGKLWLEIPSARLGPELLYITGASTGLGSNDIGLDRGQIGRERIVSFRRFGNKLLMIQPNYDFRSSDTAAAVRRAVEESFAVSTLWGSGSRRRAAAPCWWMPPTLPSATCTMRSAPWPVRARAPIGWTPREARCIRSTPEPSPATPKSRPSSP